MTHWLISDTHFWHTNIIKYCNRKYDDAEHMNLELVRNINRHVKEEDTLWHLGDFAYGREVTGPHRICSIRNSIKCNHIHLILGNHDGLIKSNIGLRALFSMVTTCYCGFIQGMPVILNHRPLDEERDVTTNNMIKSWKRQYPEAVDFWGHVHNNSHVGNPHNISIENTEYQPISFLRAISHVTIYKRNRSNS